MKPDSIDTERADCDALLSICEMLSAVMYPTSIDNYTASWWNCANVFLVFSTSTIISSAVYFRPCSTAE